MVIITGSGKDKEDGAHSGSSRSPNKSGTQTRPRPPALWSVQDVVQWFERHCGDLGAQYSHTFRQNNVNGRTLLRMNVSALERMGIYDHYHMKEIFREILKLKFKSDILELRDLERQLGSTLRR